MGRNIVLLLIFFAAIFGPCAVFAAASYASIQALGRNPSSAPKVFTAMVMALVFAEALALIAILVAFQLFSSNPNA